jgi:dTDP-4-dehydrorhamnose reductase
MPVLLVTGASGFLGSAVCRAAAGAFEVHGTWWTSRPELPGVELHHVDLRSFQELGALLMRLRPDAIVHTAYRQDDPEPWALNLAAPVRLAGAAAGLGARLVHLSTDLVLQPLDGYARGKARAEEVVLERCPQATVVRTSLLLDGRGGSRHEQAILAAARGERDMTFFDDERRCPTSVDDLAAALVELVGIPAPGTLDLAGPDVLTRLELARLVAAQHGLDPGVLRGGPGPPDRPKDLALDPTRARELLATRLRGARELLSS